MRADPLTSLRGALLCGRGFKPRRGGGLILRYRMEDTRPSPGTRTENVGNRAPDLAHSMRERVTQLPTQGSNTLTLGRNTAPG